MFLKKFRGTDEWIEVEEDSVRESLAEQFSRVDVIIDRMKLRECDVSTDCACFRYIPDMEVENAGERTVFAELTLYELTWLRKTGGDTGPLDYVMAEAGWMNESGISIENAILTDDDSDNEWERYIASLIRWAFDNIDEDCKGKKPPVFKSKR